MKMFCSLLNADIMLVALGIQANCQNFNDNWQCPRGRYAVVDICNKNKEYLEKLLKHQSSVSNVLFKDVQGLSADKVSVSALFS